MSSQFSKEQLLRVAQNLGIGGAGNMTKDDLTRAILEAARSPKGSDNRGCVKQTQSKYVNRPSPPFPGNQCCLKVLEGNDGRMYKSVPDKNGICRWQLLSE